MQLGVLVEASKKYESHLAAYAGSSNFSWNPSALHCTGVYRDKLSPQMEYNVNFMETKPMPTCDKNPKLHWNEAQDGYKLEEDVSSFADNCYK